MVKRLESSAMAFYELKHQQHHQQYQELQCRDRSVCADAGKTETVAKHHRRASDTSSSSSSSTSSSEISTKQFSSDAAQTLDSVRSGRLHADKDDVVPVTGTQTALTCGDHSPQRPTADGPAPSAGTTSNISFSISRILGHDHTSGMCSRRPGPVHRLSTGRSTPPVRVPKRSRSQSGMASPDSSCRVAGDDVEHDVKALNDVDNDDEDPNDNDVVIKLHQTQSPASAAAGVCGDTLHRLSWLHCTRYKPPKLPRKNLF